MCLREFGNSAIPDTLVYPEPCDYQTWCHSSQQSAYTTTCAYADCYIDYFNDYLHATCIYGNSHWDSNSTRGAHWYIDSWSVDAGLGLQRNRDCNESENNCIRVADCNGDPCDTDIYDSCYNSYEYFYCRAFCDSK